MKTAKKSTLSPLLKSESKIQQEIVHWYRNSFCLKHHSPRCMILSIPNEGKKAESGPLIATGLYPGCADLFLYASKNEYGFHVGHTPVFVECKTPEGVQSDKQKEFQKHCDQMNIPYFLVRSLDEFKQVIKNL